MALAIALTPSALLANGPGGGTLDGLRTELMGGRTWLNLRYRYEDVDSNPGRQGNASTLRTVLGYETGSYENFRALIEFEDTLSVLDNHHKALPTPVNIPDPTGGSVNQLYITYEGVDNLDVRLGRQEITLDNERFIGDNDWRQSHQAFDAVSLQYTGIENLIATYVYVGSVDTDFNVDVEQNGTHLLNGSMDLQDVGRITGYYYVLESNDVVKTGIPFVRPASHETYGLRFSGDLDLGDVGLNYTAEYARQEKGRASRAASFNEEYYNIELGGTVVGINTTLQFEHLGGPNTPRARDAEFSTPMADRHRHNGLADIFGGGPYGSANVLSPAPGGLHTIPGAGLNDMNIKVTGDYADVNWLLAYHLFGSAEGYMAPAPNPPFQPRRRDEYGHEIDLQVAYALNDHTDVGIMFARFTGYNLYQDTAKFAAWLSYTIL